VLLPVPSCHRRRGLQSSHTGAPIQFVPIAWREHLQLAAKRPMAGVGGSATAGAACLSRSVPHLHRSVNMRTHSGLDFAPCAVNRSIASAGTLTFGVPVPTRTRSGTVLASSPGSSGTRRVARSSFCGVCKVGVALKAAGGCGGARKLTIASRCSRSGANTGTRLGRYCSIFGGCPTFRLLTATFTRRNAPQKRGTVPRALFRYYKPLIERKLEPFKTIKVKWREPNAAKRQLTLLPSVLP
jgi:hypothetical protein